MKTLLTLLLSVAALLLAGEKFAPGVTGNALDGRARLTFDTAKLTPARGTAVFWFKTAQSADTMKNIMLLGLGINKPGWFYIHLNRGQFGVNVRAAKGSTRVECPAKELSPGKWHHAAVVWGKRKNGFIRLYLNGKLCAYQRLDMPESFSSNNLAVGYNASNWKGPSFPGLIDEVALFDVPLSEGDIQQIYRAGMAKKALPATLPGRLLYFPFDGNITPVAGKAAEDELARKMLREAYAKVKLKKYDDETEFQYSYSLPTNEKTPEILTDGNNGTGVHWRQVKVSVTGVFDSTREVTEIEMVTRKYTKWYLLKQLQVSWDDGSGNFSDPVIVNTYAFGKPISKELVDDTCKEYVYSVKNPGKMSRFKITLIGDGYFGINEIRVRAKK